MAAPALVALSRFVVVVIRLVQRDRPCPGANSDIRFLPPVFPEGRTKPGHWATVDLDLVLDLAYGWTQGSLPTKMILRLSHHADTGVSCLRSASLEVWLRTVSLPSSALAQTVFSAALGPSSLMGSSTEGLGELDVPRRAAGTARCSIPCGLGWVTSQPHQDGWD